jgi:hypothetical protein
MRQLRDDTNRISAKASIPSDRWKLSQEVFHEIQLFCYFSYGLYSYWLCKSKDHHTDIRAAEKAFGIKGGSISFGMGITKQDGINIFLNTKTNNIL